MASLQGRLCGFPLGAHSARQACFSADCRLSQDELSRLFLWVEARLFTLGRQDGGSGKGLG
jgi:hypothetical protein